MAGDRLNQGDRGKIADRVIEHSFKDRIENHTKHGNSIAEAILAEHIKGFEEIYKKVPKEWLPKKNYLCVSTFSEGWAYAYFSESRSIPQNMDYRETFSKNDPLYSEVTKFIREKNKIESDKVALRAKIKGVLCSASNYKTLLEKWPEVAPFLKLSEQVTNNLPATLISDLNKEIGLPIKENEVI